MNMIIKNFKKPSKIGNNIMMQKCNILAKKSKKLRFIGKNLTFSCYYYAVYN